MQILHPFAGSIQQYNETISDLDRYRPVQCPQCYAKQPLTGHGFYQRTIVGIAFDGVIRVRRYLCRACRRTVSLLPEFALPWMRFSIPIVALFLAARLLNGLTLAAAAREAGQRGMPYQRGQFWIHRFRKQAPALGVSLASLTVPLTAADFVLRSLRMLESIGWIAAHRFLFSQLRVHLLGWPHFSLRKGDAPHCGFHRLSLKATHIPFAWRKSADTVMVRARGFPDGRQSRKTCSVPVRACCAAGTRSAATR